MKGFSAGNFRNLRQFAGEYIKIIDLPQPVAEIPWGHNITLIEKIKSTDEREFYIKKTIENGWSRNVLIHQIDSFKPEYAGKLNFYLSAVDDLLRDIPADNPIIGLLLCKERNDIVVEYALRDLSKPMGISTYYLKTPPEEMEKLLPTVKELQDIMDETE